MGIQHNRYAPGQIRDAVVRVLSETASSLPIKEIIQRVSSELGRVPESSIRSYIGLNTPELFVRESRGVYRLRRRRSGGDQPELPGLSSAWPRFKHRNAVLFNADCFDWLRQREQDSIHAVVTDPPYGLHEYSKEQQTKLRNGKGGVWRIPPSFDGHTRSPLPRFTTLTKEQLHQLKEFFALWGELLWPALVPGAHVLVASNPLVSHYVSFSLSKAGYERRGEIIRLTMTMRGGDRPKAAHDEFPEVSVLPRSMWEPWLIFRKPIEGRVQDNLRKWKTGGFRRPSRDKPFGDVIKSHPTRKSERQIAPHPSLKPQSFLRQVVHAVLPLGEGVVLDPFAGSGSTLAAALAVGYQAIGVEEDESYFELAQRAIPRLAEYSPGNSTKGDKSSSPEAF